MKVDIREVHNGWKAYTLTSSNGTQAEILDFGGIITKLNVPDKNGNLENVVIGYDDYADYESNPNYFGALIGRVAGRISGSAFEMAGQKHELPANDGPNHLHGGPGGFHQRVWEALPFQMDGTAGVKLTLASEDGNQGYPGSVKITVTYTLNEKNELTVSYEAVSDKTTPLTLTNHSYFNLSGNLKDTIHGHRLKMNSSKYLELDDTLIPTGQLNEVEGTSFDFRSGRQIGDGLNMDTEQQKNASGGYDHYFIFDHENAGTITLSEQESGRILNVHTDQPGVVLYTSNSLGDDLTLAGGRSQKHLGVCLETQGSPASLHHTGFPEIILQAGDVYRKQTTFTFSTES